MGRKSVSKKRATKLVKKGKATISTRTGKSGDQKITKIKRKARKGDAWISSEDMGKTKTVRPSKKKKPSKTKIPRSLKKAAKKRAQFKK